MKTTVLCPMGNICIHFLCVHTIHDIFFYRSLRFNHFSRHFKITVEPADRLYDNLKMTFFSHRFTTLNYYIYYRLSRTVIYKVMDFDSTEYIIFGFAKLDFNLNNDYGGVSEY